MKFVILFLLIFPSFAQSIQKIGRDLREIKEKMVTKEELREVKEELKEVKEKMVTREEFKLFIDMVNKRFEDINRRFEDIHNYMTVIFVVLGLIQGFIMVLIGVMGFRLLRSISELKEMVRKEVIYPELKRMKEEIKREILEEVNRIIKEHRV